MRNYFLLSAALFTSFNVHAQLSDNFTDGDFTANPVWTVRSNDWIVNAASQLQSNNTVAGSSFYITTPSTLATVAQWEFYVNLNFQTSGSNYVDVFLTASSSDLTSAATTGYYIRIGNTNDDISLYKKDGANGPPLIDGVNGSTNASNNTIRIKVTRDASDQWKLYRDLTGGTNYFIEGSVTDNTFNTSSFFGILVKQSTAGFFQKHFFDDITVQDYIPDTAPPFIISVTATGTNTADVLFNEPIDNTSGQAAAHYVVNNTIGAATATVDAANNALVHLSFSNSFADGSNNSLTVNAVQDANGNTLSNGTATFFFYLPKLYDVVIDEILADSLPQVALPKKEWIELKNTAAFPVNLAGWRIGDGSGKSGPLPGFILKPDSFVIVCNAGAGTAMSAYGATISPPAFPALSNDGELLYVEDADGNSIHAVNYTINWFRNEIKKDGGWSLEMVDPKNPCAGFSNWKASVDESGGTPGRKNSVDAANTDEVAPELVRAYATDSLSITLLFDEPLNTSNTSVTANYTISDGAGTPVSALATDPIADKVVLTLASPLLRNKIYTVTATGLTDCTGNIISTAKTARVGLSETVDSFDVVINEVLFNPPSNGSDYVELYNRSKKIIDLQQLFIANRNTTGIISNQQQLSEAPYLLFPGEFMVLTKDEGWVKNTFITKNPNAFITIASMPSYNDDAGDVVLSCAQHPVVDELKYLDDWHFKLLGNKEGVALERIDYNAATQQQANWHSAATHVNYGTPTYQNSQFKINDAVQGEIRLSPEILSPDNDGQDDFATVDYNFPEAGYVATITIFDASGRPVRYLQRNALCGTAGNFRWDGLGEKNQPLATGVYLVLTEVFNLGGNKKQFKKAIVLARRH